MSVSANRLIHETSPYLLQHANNPVDWFPWGEEAFTKARRENKPLLVSIGYSACHWCHVMERESFEDEDTAAFMNLHFINIKIDREERPDLDHIYMDAVQAISGSGGWPLNIFLTTDQKPFFGGTYFPPVRAHNRVSWIEVLTIIKDAWLNKRNELEAQATTLTKYIEDSSDFLKEGLVSEDGVLFDEGKTKSITAGILASFDKENGGFGLPPKFPQTYLLAYLLMYGNTFKDTGASEHAVFSLKKMIRGGIYDHLAGGMCRYSTDSSWLLPHFEKMLYDNALLMNVLCDAFQITGDQEMLDAIESIYGFLFQELRSSEGGYYSAIDADSEGEEGKYYVWGKSEVDQITGEEAELACDWFDVSEGGNWDGKNILNTRYSIAEFCNKHRLDEISFSSKAKGWKRKLLSARSVRQKPGIDDKIILGWNSLLITALCKAFKATKDEKYRKEAKLLESFLENRFIQNGSLKHTYTKGQAKYGAFLDDYSFFIQAKIHLQEITGDQDYLFKAKDLTGIVLSNFKADSGLFYYTSALQTDIVVRKIEFQDGAIPSGNSIMCWNLMYLATVFEEKTFGNIATNGVKAISRILIKHPFSMGIWANLYLSCVLGTYEIVITGTESDQMIKDILQVYLPNKVFQSSKEPRNMPLLLSKQYETQALIYVCKDNICKVPLDSVEEFLSAI